MTLSRDEAANSLRDIAAAEHRSSTAYGYRRGAPFLILWGVIWLIGYGEPWLFPPGWRWLWPSLVAIGTLGSFAIGRFIRPAGQAARDERFALTFVAVFAFVWAQMAIFHPSDPAQIAAYFPILVALHYVLIGIWSRGHRMTLLGLFVAGLTLGCYFWLTQYLLPLMAVVGGGGLILGGLWLRTA